jgi:RHS repeat-associated protein
VWRWDQQEPFGVNVPDENPSGLGAFEFPMRFPGQYFDKETNLHYNGARDYDSGIGGYIQPESLGVFGDINLYRYGRSNPLTYTDPDGMQAAAVMGGGAASSGTGVATGVGSRAISVLGPIGAVAGAGLGGYEIGTLIYPIIEPGLSRAIDLVCKDGDREKQCNYQYYQVDIPTCRNISKKRGKPAGERCYASAAQRYAACLRGETMPPLDTWNN